MVPFKPYFIGEEVAPGPRATSVQKCFRTVDIDIIGTDGAPLHVLRDARQLQLRRLLQRADAIPLAWELFTEALGVDGDRLWVTVHETDDEAGRPVARRRGASPRAGCSASGEDNFWRWATPGPCGPCSELFFDRGPQLRRRRGARPRRRRALRRDLQPRLHAVRPPGRRHARRPAPQEHRHRGRPGAQPARAPGRRVVDLRHRRLPARAGGGRADHRRPLRRRPPRRRVAAHPGRPRPGHGHARG